jgi:hypothetical protein
MCPDNERPDEALRAAGFVPATPPQNPTLAEDDKFRRTVEPSSGPNTSGYDDLVKASHTRPDDEPSPIAAPSLAGRQRRARRADRETSAQITATQPIVEHVEPPDAGGLSHGSLSRTRLRAAGEDRGDVGHRFGADGRLQRRANGRHSDDHGRLSRAGLRNDVVNGVLINADRAAAAGRFVKIETSRSK